MRVLFVSSYPHLPDVTGGLQTTTHDLCLAIRELGAEAAVLCGRAPAVATDTDDTLTRDEHLGYPVLRATRPLEALPQVAAAWEADAIVVQSGTYLSSLVLASLDTGRPTAVYLHNVETHQLGGHLVADPSLLYLANSDFTARRWRALYGLDCAVIPPIVSAPTYRAERQGDKVLFVNPTPIKGVERLFELAAACPELPFLVMESWPLDPAWRAHGQARAARLGNVEWRGPSDGMREVFGQSRVLLMPSVWEESFGRTVVEAQLNGLPVLASRRGALPELVGDGGAVLDLEAPLADWAAALRHLHGPGAAAQRAAALRRGAAHVAGTASTVARLLGLLQLHAASVAPRVPVPAPPPAPAPTPAHAAVREVPPRQPRREDCLFYHSTTLPDGEEVVGDWDLRPNTAQYLGGVDFNGRSVLEIGPASGHLSFHMEAAGAQVTCLEPPMSHLWDVVPHEGFDTPRWRHGFTRSIEGVRHSFWYVHRQRRSRVRLIEADPYALPAELGEFDIGLMASVLLHCRRPFDMVQSVAARTRRTVIVTELYDPSLGPRALCQLQPHRGVQQVDTWWLFTPQFFVSTLGLLGFTEARVILHEQSQPSQNRQVPMFTVVCERPGA
jgi:glycosyltransferase involved in cell wall biosynthesis